MDGWMDEWITDGWMANRWMDDGGQDEGLPVPVLTSQGTLAPEEWRESNLEFESPEAVQHGHPVGVNFWDPVPSPEVPLGSEIELVSQSCESWILSLCTPASAEHSLGALSH